MCLPPTPQRRRTMRLRAAGPSGTMGARVAPALTDKSRASARGVRRSRSGGAAPFGHVGVVFVPQSEEPRRPHSPVRRSGPIRFLSGTRPWPIAFRAQGGGIGDAPWMTASANGRSSCGGSETSSWRSCVAKTKWRPLMKPPASAWAKQSAGQCAKAVPSFRWQRAETTALTSRRHCAPHLRVWRGCGEPDGLDGVVSTR
jgi:hypothetical protein